jgi:thiamine biosynthesis lipoprotein
MAPTAFQPKFTAGAGTLPFCLMNRRQFLDPCRLALRTGQVLGASEEHWSPARDSSAQAALLRVARQAMATTFEVCIPFGATGALAAAQSALDLIDDLEAQMSVYRPDSEVSRINRLAAERPVSVEKDLFSLLERAARITAETAGAFDITAGPLIKSWGFYSRSHRIPSALERAEVLDRVAMSNVILDSVRQTIQYRGAGVEINLGSIGKGHALDRAARMLREEWGFGSALLHGGHSSVYAIGATPGDDGWRVGIRHPWEPGERLAIVRLCDRALATSAATFQYLEHEGRKLGHILDPRTGWPAEEIASASVVAPSAAEADALATAFFILGVEPARDYCACHPQVGAVLLPAGEPASPVVFGLTSDEVAVNRRAS